MSLQDLLCESGGLIYHIPDDKLMAVKNSNEFPSRVSHVINLLKFPNNKYVVENEAIIFGTYNLKLQPFYGDIDMRNKIVINLPKKDAILLTKKMFQHVVDRIKNTKGAFFTDAKAGIYPDGEAVHWTQSEVLKGSRNGNKKDFNGHIGNKTLLNAIIDKPLKQNENVLLKIDVVLPFYGKYLECTNVYDVYYIDENGVIRGLNVEILSEDDERNKIIKTLLNDTAKQRKKQKFFKVIKRIFAMSRYYNDIETAKKIQPLLISNVSKLSSINSDLGTVYLLLELNKKINKNFLQVEFNMFKDKIANILDINFDPESVINDLNETYMLVKENDKKNAMKVLGDLIEYLQHVTNKEVIDYLNSIGFSSFRDFGQNYII